MDFDFDDELLNFAKTFLGYGNFKSDLWFVGKEEAGVKNKDDIDKRLKAWIKFGRNEICDIALFHNEIGIPELFADLPANQNTWRGLIKFQLALANRDFSPENVRLFQRDHLGRSDSNNLLLELLPLPSPSVEEWLYDEFSSLTILKDRETYQNYYLDQRIKIIADKILLHNPRMVVFYGYTKYKKELIRYLNIEMVQDKDIKFNVSTLGNSKLVFVDHPTAHLPPKYYETIAEKLRVFV